VLDVARGRIFVRVRAPLVLFGIDRDRDDHPQRPETAGAVLASRLPIPCVAIISASIDEVTTGRGLWRQILIDLTSRLQSRAGSLPCNVRLDPTCSNAARQFGLAAAAERVHILR
jgi:hypothetical protein